MAKTTTAQRAAIDKLGPWRCFHCAELFEDQDAAAEHFGTDWFCEDDGPACIQILTEGEKAIVNSRRDAGRALREAEGELESAQDDLCAFRLETRQITRRVRHEIGEGVHNLRCAWESMEGRALAAEAALSAAPRWLASWLRRRAERLAQRRLHASGRVER